MDVQGTTSKAMVWALDLWTDGIGPMPLEKFELLLIESYGPLGSVWMVGYLESGWDGPIFPSVWLGGLLGSGTFHLVYSLKMS
jgi:hypothetical protein